jgi:RNA polymerase sigma-B factor
VIDATVRVTPETSDHDLFRALADADAAGRELIQGILARRHAPLVRWLAARYTNRSVDFEELQAVGNVGLILAIQRFDPDRGFDFIAFARPTVQGEIRRYFRDKRRWIRLPRHLQEIKAKLGEATQVLTHQLNRAPTVAELAAELAVDPEVVLEAMTADDTFAPLSLDAPTAAGDESTTLGSEIGYRDDRFDTLVDCEALRPLIAALPERERRILSMRFFDDMTQSDIGRELNVSQMHISRLLARTLADLRRQLLRDD